MFVKALISYYYLSVVPEAIISISSSEKLHIAFQRLVEGHVYSIPVMDASGVYLGLLSISSVVGRLVNLFGERCAGLAHLSSHEFTKKEIADIT
jgi:hypothetical protein